MECPDTDCPIGFTPTYKIEKYTDLNSPVSVNQLDHRPKLTIKATTTTGDHKHPQPPSSDYITDFGIKIGICISIYMIMVGYITTR